MIIWREFLSMVAGYTEGYQGLFLGLSTFEISKRTGHKWGRSWEKIGRTWNLN